MRRPLIALLGTFALAFPARAQIFAVDDPALRRIWEEGWKKGFRWAEGGWILEDNQPMINGLERLGFARYKTYRIYERPI